MNIPETVPARPSDTALAYAPEISRDLTDIEITILAMESLSVRVGEEEYYEAADPGYKSCFPRDSAIAMSLRGNPEILEGQIDFTARRIGRVKNPMTGEEPGKAHHELPSVNTNGKNTAYNACDTTAELLRSIAVLAERGHDDVLVKYASTVQQGVAYIKNHVNKFGLFIEDPAFSGSAESDGRQRKFALKVTYWKDSELNREGSKEPHYPIVYTLAHFQNARALERIGGVLGDDRLARYGRYMTEAGVRYLWNNDHFVTAIDGAGVTDPPNSDSLHALLYIPPSQLPTGYAQKIEQYMKRLETDAGYRSGIPVKADVDPYHMGVWTHEQALLNAAARLHNLNEVEDVTRRIEPFIIPKDGIFPELLDADTLQPCGNLKQLWAMGAYLYFQNPEKSLL